MSQTQTQTQPITLKITKSHTPKSIIVAITITIKRIITVKTPPTSHHTPHHHHHDQQRKKSEVP
jgi:hypothetical protein